jgi:hypothetical protein
MSKEEIKTGMKVCMQYRNMPFCNTTVKCYPSDYYGPGFADLRGLEDPVPIADIKPYTTGLRDVNR